MLPKDPSLPGKAVVASSATPTVDFSALLAAAQSASAKGEDGKDKGKDDKDESDKTSASDSDDASTASITSAASTAVDPRMLAIALPFEAKAPAPPTKMSLDAAAGGGQMPKGSFVPSASVPAKDARVAKPGAGGANADVGVADADEPANDSSAVDGPAAPNAPIATAAKSPAAAAAATDTNAATSKIGADPSLNPHASSAKSDARRDDNTSIVRAGDMDSMSASSASSSSFGRASASTSGAAPAKDDLRKASTATSATTDISTTAAAASASGARDNSLTAANPMAPSVAASVNNAAAAAESASTADRAASAVSAANQMVMRHAAHGEIDHPELGRIGVSADMRDGNVDVRVAAERPEAAAALTAHAVHMASDVRAADIPLSKLQIAQESHGDASRNASHDSAATGNAGNHDGQRNGARASSTGSNGSNDNSVQMSISSSTVNLGDGQRVRIVL